ncbi:hypothetical protein QYE76_039022 [Lolium multiflorum]|uniref:CCHC-type domain-containing protein n=1 Tax=Lolium multiflorum TaxID=4521 RepID=A0AAD8T8W4_LOLMU|nr:hypothetical protein QYE76_039022 [Lolium multiflorum]
MVQKKPYGKNKGNNKPSFNKPMKTTTFKKKKMINKADLSCFTCGEAGHFSKDCPERADRKKKARQVNTVTASNADGYGNLFTVLSVARDSSVLMGNGSHAYVRGVGTVDLFTSGKIVQLRNVQHVPTMNKNLDDNEAPKRSKRRRIEKSFGDDFIVYLVDDTPTSIAEAYASPDADDWKEAVHNEMDSILSNGTWELSERPHGCKPVGCKWVFKKKLRPDEMEENMAHIGSHRGMNSPLLQEFEPAHVDLASENKICHNLPQGINTFTAELDRLNEQNRVVCGAHNQKGHTLMNDDDANTTIRGEVVRQKEENKAHIGSQLENEHSLTLECDRLHRVLASEKEISFHLAQCVDMLKQPNAYCGTEQQERHMDGYRKQPHQVSHGTDVEIKAQEADLEGANAPTPPSLMRLSRRRRISVHS